MLLVLFQNLRPGGTGDFRGTFFCPLIRGGGGARFFGTLKGGDQFFPTLSIISKLSSE